MTIQRAVSALVVWAFLTLPTCAQDFYIDMAVHYGNNMVNTLSNDIHKAGIRSTMRQQQRIAQRRKAGGQATGQRPAPTRGGGKTTTSPGQPALLSAKALTYGSSPEVSARVIDDTVRALSGFLTQGVSEAEFRKALESGTAQQRFAKLLREVEYSDRNLADVLAAQLVMCWQVGTQTPFYGDAATFRPVRDKMRQALRSQAWVGRLSDAQKQQLGETVALGTMLILERYEHGISSGNSQIKQQASQDAIEFVKSSLGVDLQAVSLTKNGFVPR